MFERIDKQIQEFAKKESRIKKALRKDRFIYLTTLIPTIIFGFTGIVLVILHIKP